jgi:hypothetical protein
VCRHCGMSTLPSLLGRSNTFVGSSGNWVNRSGICFAVEPMTGPRGGNQLPRRPREQRQRRDLVPPGPAFCLSRGTLPLEVLPWEGKVLLELPSQ